MDVTDIIEEMYKIEELGKPDAERVAKELDREETRLTEFAKKARDAAWKAEEFAKNKL